MQDQRGSTTLMELLYSSRPKNNRNIQDDQKNSIIGPVKYFSCLKDPRAERQNYIPYQIYYLSFFVARSVALKHGKIL